MTAIKLSKLKKGPKDLCIQRARCLLSLAEYLYELEYETRPDYAYIEEQLLAALHSEAQTIDFVFDWNLKATLPVMIEEEKKEFVLKPRANTPIQANHSETPLELNGSFNLKGTESPFRIFINTH